MFHTPGEIETPNRYRNRYGQLLEHAPFSQRDFHAPQELETHDERGEFHLVTVRVRDGHQRLRARPPPVRRGGLGRLRLSRTRSTRTTSSRAPAASTCRRPSHQTFQGPNFVICTFAPRMLDWDPEAVTLPYHHSNIQSEEVMFYAAGDYAARKGVDVGSITLHPSGLPHGPQPGRGREGARQDAHRRAGRDVGHVPPAAAHDALARRGQAGLRVQLEPG